MHVIRLCPRCSVPIREEDTHTEQGPTEDIDKLVFECWCCPWRQVLLVRYEAPPSAPVAERYIGYDDASELWE